MRVAGKVRALLFALAMHLLGWRDLSPPCKRLASQLVITDAEFPATIDSLRARNAARLQQGEIDHLIFYMLQSQEFTAEEPIDPAAAAAAQAIPPSVRRRIADFSRAPANPAGTRSVCTAQPVAARSCDSLVLPGLERGRQVDQLPATRPGAPPDPGHRASPAESARRQPAATGGATDHGAGARARA